MNAPALVDTLSGSPGPAPGGALVLIAESDTLTAGILQHRLERDGCAVEVALDGPAALQTLAEGRVRLAVLSTKLPGVNGFELVRAIRQRPGPQPAVMLLSFSTNEQDLVRGFELGADDYLFKPFSPVEFLARARRLLRTYPRTDP